MAKPPQIRSLSQEDKVAMMLYGHPNARKTSFIAECGDLKTLLVRSPIDHIPARALRSSVEEWLVGDWNEFDQVIQYLRLEGADWDWVWLDSVSLMQDQLLQSIWDDTIREKPSRAMYRADKLEYGVNMWRLEQWVRHTVGAQTVNIGITAHPWTTNNPFNEDGGEIMLPWIQGNQMSVKICAMMTVVAYMEVRQNAEGVRWSRIHTQGNETFYGKDQTDAFGASGQMDNPTLAKVDAAIKAAKAGKSTQSTGRGKRGTPAPAPTRGQRGRGRVAA